MEEEEFTLNDLMSQSKKTIHAVGTKKKNKLKAKANRQLQQQILLQQQQLLQNDNITEQNLEYDQTLKMSESLEKYLNNAFIKCKCKKERKQMQKLIIQDIKNAKDSSNMNDIDWKNKSVPLLPREEIAIKLLQDHNITTEPFQITPQQLQVVDQVVKKLKQQILTDTLDKQSDSKDNTNANSNNTSTPPSPVAVEQKPKQKKQKKQQQQQQQQLLLLQQQQKQQLQQQNLITQNQEILTKPLITFIIDSTPMELENNENSNLDEDDFDVERMKIPVVGTSTILEKEYLRLTSYPKAHEVRSLATIVKSFEYIKNKYKRREGDYDYFQSQFRSIRQDLLVQNINNDFTLTVLEENARICLENHDIQEYSRCLGQLIWMYKEHPNKNETSFKEFVYYRLLQNILEDKKDNLLTCLQEINQDDLLQSREFERAMQFQYAINMGNVKGFFNLYNNTEDHGKYLIALNIKRWKIWGIRILCKTYGPQAIYLSVFQSMFGYQSQQQALHDLQSLNCVFDENNEKMLVKDTLINLDQMRH